MHLAEHLSVHGSLTLSTSFLTPILTKPQFLTKDLQNEPQHCTQVLHLDSLLNCYTTNQNDFQVILQLHYDACILTEEAFHLYVINFRGVTWSELDRSHYESKISECQHKLHSCITQNYQISTFKHLQSPLVINALCCIILLRLL